MVCTSIPAIHNIEMRLGLGQHAANAQSMDPLAGADTIPTLNGRLWKTVHQMLLPAFRPAAIRQLMRTVAAEARLFRDRVDAHAARGDVFSMELLGARMVFAVNARTIIGSAAPQGKDDVHADLRVPVEGWAAESGTWNVLRRWRLRRARKGALERSGRFLRETILARYQELKADDGEKKMMKKKSGGVGDSILDNCVLERIRVEDEAGVGSLERDPAWVELLVNNLRALLLGAQGTTNDTLCCILMLLSTHPECLAALREEHDRVTGGRSFEAAEVLLAEQPQRLAELEYTTAVIREALRLFPVGFTVKHNDRVGEGEEEGYIEFRGTRYPTLGKDAMICMMSHTMHFDPAIFREPSRFHPGRWLDAPSPEMFKAWHPFSGGAHVCLGRELAMDELRGYLLCLVRWFDFELADLEPRKTQRVGWMDLDMKLGDLAFQELQLSAKPRGGVMMRARRTEKAW